MKKWANFWQWLIFTLSLANFFYKQGIFIVYLWLSLCMSFNFPADTDVCKISSGCLKKVTTSYNQTRRCYNVWQKTSDLRRLEDAWFTSCWRNPSYDVLRTSGLRDVLKTSDLHCLEDIWFPTSWWHLICNVLKTFEQRCSNVYTASKEMFFSYFVLSEIFIKF